MSRRSGEVVETITRRRIDVCCLQETRWKGGSCRWFGPQDSRYKFLWQGREDGSAGVGILVAKKWAEKIVGVERISERCIVVRILVGERVCHFMSAYAPQVGRSDREKDAFWTQLTHVVGRIPDRDMFFLGADLNGHVGRLANGYEGVHGGHGFGERNNEGLRILDFADAHGLVLSNTCYKKEAHKLITYSSGGNESTIDYILTRSRDRNLLKDSKVIPGNHQPKDGVVTRTPLQESPSRDRKSVV